MTPGQKFDACYRRLLSFVVAVMIVGCAPFNMDEYKNMLRSGFVVIPYASQIDHLFHDVDHFVGSDLSPVGTRTWNSEAFFFGRYVLTMQIQVIVSPGGRRIERAVGEPRFRLVEVSKVSLNDGEVTTDFNRASERHFGLREWEAICKADGDFTVVGIHVERAKPIPQFDVFRTAVGAPRVNIDTDKPR